MLTLKQIIELYNKGLIIKISKKQIFPYLKGHYEYKQIIIYPKNHTSQKDQDLTILHELLHARNDIKKYLYRDSETEVEREANQTYNKRPQLIKFTNWLYRI